MRPEAKARRRAAEGVGVSVIKVGARLLFGVYILNTTGRFVKPC
jgi:hypothetical protein